jgi:hypothetical protein
VTNIADIIMAERSNRIPEKGGSFKRSRVVRNILYTLNPKVVSSVATSIIELPYPQPQLTMPDIRSGIVTSVGKMAKTITVTTRTMNAVPKLLVVSQPSLSSTSGKADYARPFRIRINI